MPEKMAAHTTFSEKSVRPARSRTVPPGLVKPGSTAWAMYSRTTRMRLRCGAVIISRFIENFKR